MPVSHGLNVTAAERQAIEELKRRISQDVDQNRYHLDELCYKYLKARDFNVPVAENMFKQMILWRKQNNIDALDTDYKEPEVLQLAFGNFMVGHDKENDPFYYAPIGRFDLKGLYMSAKYADIEKTLVKLCEDAEKYQRQERKRTNRLLGGVVYILDIEGLTFSLATDKRAYSVVAMFFTMVQDNYPECLKKIFVINAGSLFTFAFSVLKNFLSAGVLSKVEVYGSGGYTESILKQIDADQLPAFLGGNRTDPDGDPSCKTFVNLGGKIDPSYYICSSKKSLAQAPGVKKLVLRRTTMSEVPLDIKEAGSTIEWEFETKMRDVGFGLFYQDGDRKSTELIPLQRLNAEELAETGMFKCEKSGRYVMLFDNSYSWFRSKEIFYRVTIVRPADQQELFIK